LTTTPERTDSTFKLLAEIEIEMQLSSLAKFSEAPLIEETLAL
jgi:hypothetical protein